MDELVSVVIPTCNRADSLARAVDSARMQTYKKLEIIIVSDGSTDSTDSVAQALQKQYPQIRYFSYSPGKGGNFARNYGAQHARGDVLAFLDDDDIWQPQKVEKQMQVMRLSDDIGLVYTGALAIYENEGSQYTITPRAKGDLSREIFKANLIGITSTVMVKKEVFEKAGQFDDTLPARQDYDLWIRACQVCTVGYVQEPLVYYYNRTGKSQVSRNFDRYKTATEMIIVKYAHLQRSSIEKKNFEYAMYMMAAKHAMRVGETANARLFLRKALRLRMTNEALIRYISTYLLNRRLMLLLRKMKG